MITIGSYLHRDALKDIISRWMYDNLLPGDIETITRLVHFNNLYVSRYLQCFADQLFRSLYGENLQKSETALKGELKDACVRNPPYRTPRIEELLRQYNDHPGRFFRETPCRATLFFIDSQGSPRYVGSSRIKRIRRLAEKGARRIIDGIFETIRQNADALAEERARLIGVQREGLITSSDEMLAEFLKAEESLLEDLRFRRPIQRMGERVIDDVAGIKVILEDGEQVRLKTSLESLGNCTVLEEESHSGRYNAVNRIVCYRPPKEEILRQPPDSKLLALMERRGHTSEETKRAFADFVRNGEDYVRLEIIASSYQEMLESEIGRCMHEDRIIEQRLKQQYRGHLSKNVEYLMRYLFIFPLSNRLRLEALPIKIWNRYLPEYVDAVIADLFQVSPYDI